MFQLKSSRNMYSRGIVAFQSNNEFFTTTVSYVTRKAVPMPTEFFTINTKLPMFLMFVSTEANKVTSEGIQPDDHWFKGLMLTLLS